MKKISLTLNSIENGDIKIKEKDLETVCKSCPNAIWHITVTQRLRVFCLLLRSLVDERMLICDGVEIPVFKEQEES